MKYESRITRYTIAPVDEPIFSEMATHIEIEDESGGEFVVIGQCNEHSKDGKIAIDPEEWPLIRDTVEKLMATLKPQTKS